MKTVCSYREAVIDERGDEVAYVEQTDGDITVWVSAWREGEAIAVSIDRSSDPVGS